MQKDILVKGIYGLVGTETCNWANIGGIVGYKYNGNIENCTNSAQFLSAYSAVGGIVGFDDGNKSRRISNCNNTANVSITLNGGEYVVGGIVGECYNSVVIENCNNSGDISCNEGWIGGINGNLSSGKIINCKNTGNITGRARVGGISGQLTKISDSSLVPEVNNSSNEGIIKAIGSLTQGATFLGTWGTWESASTGGIVGNNEGGKIISCKNKGSILSSQYGDIGGIVGDSQRNSSIQRCSNYAEINNTNIILIGGIAGYTNQCIIEECFNAKNITGNTAIGGIVGETTYTTVKNCYNIATITGNSSVGGIEGDIANYKNEIGYEYLYNCYNVGMIYANSNKDCWIGVNYYLTYDYICTILNIYNAVGDGTWYNASGQNCEVLSDSAEGKTKMLTILLNGNGVGKWTRDTTGVINNGYPYLVNNRHE